MARNIEFGAEMKDLTALVNLTRNGLGSSKTDLTTALIRIELQGDKLSMFATDKESFVHGTTNVKKGADSEDGSFAILGTKLAQLTSQVDAESIRFKVDDENAEVTAAFLTVNLELYDDTTIKTLQTALLQELIPLKDGTQTACGKTALEEGLMCAKSCTTSQSVRPDVTHAELRNQRILSSDGRKILIYSHPGFPTDMKMKVPAPALAGITGALKNTDTERVSVAEGKSYYHMYAEKVWLGVRKVERSFPNVEGMISKAEAATDEIVVDKVVLEAMVKGVSLGLASDDVKVTVDIGGQEKEAYMEVSATNAVNRRSHERVSVGRKLTTPLSFPISFKHLLDTLGVFKGDSVVDLMVMQTKNILLVRDTTEEREVLTVIPFRTQAAIDAERKEAADKAREAEEKKKAEQEKAEKEKAEQEKEPKDKEDKGAKAKSPETEAAAG